MKILVADDDGTTRKVLQAFLTQLKYETQIVENGVSALAVLKGPNAPHIAIIDWMMPDMEGLEVCRQIRSTEPAIDPYVMILTSKKEKVDIAAALDAGADDVLSKPFNILEMSARLRVAERSIKRQFRRYNPAANEPAAPSPGAAAPIENVVVTTTAEPSVAGLAVTRIHEIVLGVLREAGLPDGRTLEDTMDLPRAKGFTVWSGFALATPELWLDIVLQIDEASAESFFSQMEGEPPADHGRLLTFLKQIHTSFIGAFQRELQNRGTAMVAPFSPIGSGASTLRLPEDFRRLSYSLRQCLFGLTFAVQPCPLQLKRPERLLSWEILAESYPRLKKEEVTLLNKGAVLNARFIDKIAAFDLSTEEKQLVPVFEPSPMALDFLAMSLPSANAR